jgi:YVTN family beta-propeller protein
VRPVAIAFAMGAIIVVAAIAYVALSKPPSLPSAKSSPSSTSLSSTTTSEPSLSAISNATSSLGVIATVTVSDTGYSLGTPLFDPQNGDVYVPSTTGNQISVISGLTNTVIANVTVGSGYEELAFDPENGNIYAATQPALSPLGGEPSPPGSMSVISGETNRVIANLTFPQGITSPPIVDSDNGYVYLTTSESSEAAQATLWAVSGASNKIVSSVPIPFSVDPFFDPLNGDIYVPGDTNSSAHLSSTGLQAVVVTLPTFEGVPPALDPSNGDMYFPDSSSIIVLSGESGAVLANMSVGDSVPQAPVFDPANGDIYDPCDADNGKSGSLLVISGSTNSIVANLTMGIDLFTPALISTTGDVAIPDGSNDTVFLVSGLSNTVAREFQVDEGPPTPAYDSDNGDLYVPGTIGTANGPAGVISVIGSWTNGATFSQSRPAPG